MAITTPQRETPALTSADCELIAAYAMRSRDYYAALAWPEAEPRLAAGWRRVRGQCALEWAEVAALIRAIWIAPRVRPTPRRQRASFQR
jgi:hypothetical protein